MTKANCRSITGAAHTESRPAFNDGRWAFSGLVILCLLFAGLETESFADGRVTGNAGGIEKSVRVFSREGGEVASTITGPSGQFEFTLPAGEYMMDLSGNLIMNLRVRDGETTVANHADQPSISMEKELWAHAHRSFGQSYVATGTAFGGVTMWMAGGNTRMRLHLYEGEGMDGPPVADPVDSEGEVTWITGVHAPEGHFPTEPGKTYTLLLESLDGREWNMGMPRLPDPYDQGIAYFDGVPHPESDLGVDIHEKRQGIVQIAAAHKDLHFIEEGPGSGNCRSAGQTFVATTPNLIRAGSNCGWGPGVTEFSYAIYEDGPEGRQIGSTRNVTMVSNWGASTLWFPDEIPLEISRTYFLKYWRNDGEPFFSYLSADVYPNGIAYRDDRPMPEFDQFFEIRGEVEPWSLAFPYNVKIKDITGDSAKVCWETGVESDSVVDYGINSRLELSEGNTEERTPKHEVVLTGLTPGTDYFARPSSFTYRKGSARVYGRSILFFTTPGGEDRPKYLFPAPAIAAPTPDPRGVTVKNPGFEQGFTGWSRCAATGHPEKDEYRTGVAPFGGVSAGVHGYHPRSGKGMYGWLHLQADDPNPEVPREDWNQEVIYQRIKVEPGREYVFTAWIITGDRGRGWGRDTRIRLAVDPEDRGVLEQVATAENGVATQWFATRNEWVPVSLRFTPTGDHAAIGLHFLQWWALEANYLFADQVSVSPAQPETP